MRSGLLRFLRLTERPEPPPGAGPTLVTFRASRRFFQLQAAGWAIRHLLALVGIAISLVFLSMIEAGSADFPADRALRRLVERIAHSSWEEIEARVAAVWQWAILIEALAIASFVVGAWLSWMLLRLDWEARWYMVSDESLRIREGLFRTHERTMTVANIQNLSIRRGPLQKLLGIADLEVHTAGGGAAAQRRGKGRGEASDDLHVGRFRGIEGAEALRDRIQRAVLRHRDSGLGDPDDLPPPAAHDVPAHGIPAGHGAAEAAVLAAARALAAEARALRVAAGALAAPWRQG